MRRLASLGIIALFLLVGLTPAQTTQPAPAADGEIQARSIATGHLLVSPTINGERLSNFIFDTGAGMSCLDKPLVEKLKLPLGADAVALGTGGKEGTHLYAIKSLELGPVRLGDSTIVELALAPISLAIGEKIDGIIGYECFLNHVFEIDLADARILVHDPASYKLPDGAAWQPLIINNRRPYVNGSIEGHEEGLFLIDTGQTGSVTVQFRSVNKFKLLENRKTDDARSGGVGGIHPARRGELSSFTFAGQKLENVKAVFAQTDKGDSINDKVQGVIGLDLLAKYKLILNYPQQKIALISRER
jgi:predicted aspartyl protease